MVNVDLISVIVATYNSEAFILETLDSIYDQTYKNIELIICDDCSKDHTANLIATWLQDISQERFNSIKFIKHDVNLGVTGNFNDGISQSSGVWIKCIAGDDLLMPNCIGDLYDSAKSNVSDIVFGQALCFTTNLDGGKSLSTYLTPDATIEKFKLGNKDFFNDLMNNCFLPAPTAFFSKDVWNMLGGYDTRYIMMEDWPFWLKAVLNKRKMIFINKLVVMYRQHDQSITARKYPLIPSVISTQWKKDSINFSYHFRRHYMSNVFMKWEIINLYFASKSLTCSSRFNRIIYLFVRLLSPLALINFVSVYFK